MTGSSPIVGVNPFVGPRPLETGQRIFGRDREIDELYYLLSAERIVLLHSPSGAGKSSLIRAGLIPRLAERFDVRGPARVNAQPSDEAGLNRYVRSANLGFEEGLPEDRQRGDEFVSRMTLAQYVDSRPRRRSAPQNVVLIFDQFEEILTADPLAHDAKREFFRQLGELLQNPRIWALFALREDYLAPLDPYATLVPTHLKNRFRLDLLSREAAQQAMVGTAAEGGCNLAPAAATKLVTDLATMRVQQADGTFQSQVGPHVEPLHLQVACRGLWKKMFAYREGGPIAPRNDLSIVGDVDEALAVYYDEVVGALAGNDRVERRVREWMAKLITPAGTRGQLLKGVGNTEGLDNAAVEKLVTAHLVRAEHRAGAVWFELSHDRMIAPVLLNNTVWAEPHGHPLQKAAALWESQGRPPRLLHAGSDLAESRRWAKDNPEEITDSEHQFLRAALEARKRKEALLRLASLPILFMILAVLVRLQVDDLHFRVRGSVPTSDIILVTANAGRFPEPQLFWHPHYAKVIGAVGQGGAKVLGLCYLPFDGASVAKWEPTYDALMIEAVTSAPMPVVMGFVLAGFINTDQATPLAPIKVFASVTEMWGFTELTADQDDFIRRQVLMDSTGEPRRPRSLSLALRIAEKFLGEDATLENGVLKLKGEAIPLDEDRSIVINYAGPGEYAFPSVPMAEVEIASEQQLKQWFEGKIVLLGDIMDRRNTPISINQWRTAGVEIHANTLRTILQRRYLVPVPTWARWGAFITIFLVGFLTASKFNFGIMSACALGQVTVILVGTHQLFLAGWTLPIAPLTLTMTVSILAGWVHCEVRAARRDPLI